MQFSNWLLFCGVALLVSFTPGPAVLMAISNSVALGPRRAMVGSLGNAVGLFLVSAVAMAGMGVVLAASAAAFTALKLGGAAYLVYLGIRQWRSRVNLFSGPQADGAPLRAGEDWRLFVQGTSVALTNPKGILFFSALFPQFLSPQAPVLTQFLVLTGTFVACAILSHAVYVLLGRVLRRQFASESRTRLFNRLSGSLFVFLGFSLLSLRGKAA